MTTSAASLTATEARRRLADEWRASNPTTPDEIAAWYRDAQHQGPDLAAFHRDPTRKQWTARIVQVAQEQGAQRVVDIGCGAGHDLMALREAVPTAELWGVEPCMALREEMRDRRIAHGPGLARLSADVLDAPIETADLLICIDVLEHVPDPETFLSDIARRAPVGAWCVEATATHDHGTPLHLEANHGWHPGHAFEAAGWELVSREGRLHVWHRVREATLVRADLVIATRRPEMYKTARGLINLVASADSPWRIDFCTEDGIGRGRSIAISQWYRQQTSDVFVFIDDDIVFRPDQVEHLVDHCRNGYPIVCGAYSVRDGSHLALRGLNGTSVTFGGGLMQPVEIDSVATGFLAIHRSVMAALIETVPECYAGTRQAFWPVFDSEVVPHEALGWEWLSEDYFFSRKAKGLGFKIWVAPAIILGHLGTVEVGIPNMSLVHQAITGRT